MSPDAWSATVVEVGQLTADVEVVGELTATVVEVGQLTADVEVV